MHGTWLQTDTLATLSHFEWHALNVYLEGKTAVWTWHGTTRVRYSHKLNSQSADKLRTSQCICDTTIRQLSVFGRSKVSTAEWSFWCHITSKCAATNFGFINCDQTIKIDPQLSWYGYTGQLNMAPRSARTQMSAGHAITNPRIAESRKCDEVVICEAGEEDSGQWRRV